MPLSLAQLRLIESPLVLSLTQGREHIHSIRSVGDPTPATVCFQQPVDGVDLWLQGGQPCLAAAYLGGL